MALRVRGERVRFTLSLRANGSPECTPDDRLREPIHRSASAEFWIASSLRSRGLLLRLALPLAGPPGLIDLDRDRQHFAAAAVAGAAHRRGAQVIQPDGDT